MKYLQSKDFKSSILLEQAPGDQVSIQCRNYADVQSKATACRSSFKLKEEKYRQNGVTGLKVQKIGDNVVLVTLMKED